MVFQSPSRVMLVKPAVFEFNPQTSLTNRFQEFVLELSKDDIYRAAMAEWQGLRDMYARTGVGVEIFESDNRHTPDAIFPNCVSTFPGAVFGQAAPVAVLHPMHAENRIAERSDALINFFAGLGYEIKRDLLKYEDEDMALEGTGSVVMDHLSKIAYAALSPRTDLKAAEAFAALIGYRLEAFNTRDLNGKPVYHTDLVMNICTGFSEVCAEVIVEEDRKRIVSSMKDNRADVNELSMRQFNAFCGNSLEVRNSKGDIFFSTSTKSLHARSPEQAAVIREHVKDIIHSKVRMIERVGGGSDRCLTQELHGLSPSMSREKTPITVSS